jgi:hypothetical protein
LHWSLIPHPLFFTTSAASAEEEKSGVSIEWKKEARKKSRKKSS